MDNNDRNNSDCCQLENSKVVTPKKYQNRYVRRSMRLREKNKCDKIRKANSKPLLQLQNSIDNDKNDIFEERFNECISKFSPKVMSEGTNPLKFCCTTLKNSNSCPELHNIYIDALLQRCHSSPSVNRLSHPKSEISNHTMPFQSAAILNCDKPTLQDSENNLDEKDVTCDNQLSTPANAQWKAQHLRSKSDGTGAAESINFTNEIHKCVEGILSSSLPVIFTEKEQLRKKSIFEGGAIVVPTECFFPTPQPGQTLTSFLSSGFNICAELDRENAHFCISEALISAIEHIKCNESETLKIAAEEAESDEEIKKLTQRIRIRRREKLQEKVGKNSLAANGKGDTTTTSQSASPMSTSHSSDFCAGDSIGSDDDDDNVADIDISDSNVSNLTSMKESGLSLSMASMYSDADIQKALFAPPSIDMVDKKVEIDTNNTQLSAEAVALSLLKRFSEKQLPKASDLQWLVSERDAPQGLLPLPDSWPVSPDAIDEEYVHEQTRLRGNSEWAPPRQQIIFMVHPTPKRKDALLKQNYRCAGCGMKVERNYIKKFRYCDYLGKFFCQCCHSNNMATIPSRVIHKWDFKQYYVSKFSWKLLDQMHYDPLFNVMDNNNHLYRKIRQLELCRTYRMQMFYLRDFIRTCRKCEQIQKEFEAIPEHIYQEPHLYSMEDFFQVRSGDLSKLLHSIVTKCISHIMHCILCQAKGFICELCNKSEDIIFPFQLNKVCHCAACRSCFHKWCFKNGTCPKCARIKARQKRLQDQK